MYKSEAVAIFGSQTALGEALGISQEAVSQWGETIPKLREFQINKIIEQQSNAKPQETAA